MEDKQPDQKKIYEFENMRQQLFSVSQQKNQFQTQKAINESALGELEKTKAKEVYKAVGNILILQDRKLVEKELKEKNESLELRLKSFQKQEETLIEKLNKLRAELEGEKK